MDIILGQGIGKVIIGFVSLLVAIFIIGILQLITGSFILSTLILLAIIWYLLRQLGTFVMYPGSFFMTSSQIQLKGSKQLGNRIYYLLRAISSLSVNIMQRQYFSQQNDLDYHTLISIHIDMMIKMLQMFQTTLSDRKKKMMAIYREINTILNDKLQEGRCITQFIDEPKSVITISQEEWVFFKVKLQRIGVLVMELFTILKTYQPPTDTLKSLQFKLSSEKLYEIRYAYFNWKALMNYQMFLIKTQDKNILQSVLIHSYIKRNIMMNSNDDNMNSASNRAILFCNPNGVFIQYFGMDNQYVRNYVKLGYHVILWNYRGYAQSTGIPSIKLSQEDAFTVYQFYTERGYKIQIVHGYSIGGAAAVSLPSKLSQKPYIKNNIQILIIDRSFSSIGQMSIQFGNTLHNLTKLIFYTQNIDLSKQFQEIKCKKLLIWDNCDQVIPDKASVKNKIIKRKKNSKTNNKKKSINKFDQDSNEKLQMNQLIEEDNRTSEYDFQNICRKLYETMEAVVKEANEDDDVRRFNVQGGREELKSEESTNRSSLQEPMDINVLFKILNSIDGGGIKLFQNIKQLQKIYKDRPDYFYHICQSYVLGLICYGSYIPLKPIIHDHPKIKQQTLQKIQQLLKDLRSQYKINDISIDELYNSPVSLNQIPRNIYFIFSKLLDMVNVYFSQEWFIIHGSLLPTYNGHNQNLSQFQFNILNAFIKNSLAVQIQPVG